MKRKQPDSRSPTKSTPKRRKSAPREDEGNEVQDAEDTDELALPSTKGQVHGPERTPRQSRLRANGTNGVQEHHDDEGSSTPKPNETRLFTTPRKKETPGRLKKADQSAKRKAATALAEQQLRAEWADDDGVAEEIVDEEDDLEAGEDSVGGVEAMARAAVELGEEIEVQTPSKRGRGRPKGAKNKRSPTPEGDLPPEERYFFQNRSGPPQVSSNTLAGLKLLTHDEYFEQIRSHNDHHEPEKAYLTKLHARAFPQWRFELSEGFSTCLYGWGSKRQLVAKFAEWLYRRTEIPPKIVIVNGYLPKVNIRTVLSTLTTTVMGEDAPSRLTGQPEEMLDTVLAYINSYPPTSPIVVMINSVDSSSLRRPATQSLLARLARHDSISLLVTTDTPTCALMWNASLKNMFNFAFHDCTTFAPYDVELNVVDEVHELLGQKGQRVGGKDGVGFVLKSLPENARNLYRVLLTEILMVMNDGVDGPAEEDHGQEDVDARKAAVDGHGEVGIEYRALYQKASEEFICSSDMNFRFLLKEFHDHQMVTSRRDASGTELLGVPLGKEEMTGVLEDLVVG